MTAVATTAFSNSYPFRSILILIAWLAFQVGIPLATYAQEYNNIGNIKFELLSDGLSEKSVTCILQDRKGFMWFGTRNGLNRYDGVEFRIYESTYGDTTSISSNFINSLAEDSVGNIWVGTLDAGLNLYNREMDNFKRFSRNRERQEHWATTGLQTYA